MRQKHIDNLWYEIETYCCLMSDVGDAAKALGYYNLVIDNPKPEVFMWPSSRVEPENNYWMRNATFALFILAAEGEL